MHCAEVQSSVLRCKKTMIHLMKKICMFSELNSSMSYSAIGPEFNVNEPTIYIK